MRSKFEEKSYEGYFNNELDRRSDIYFPLGQVQEGNLGFDATAFSRNRRMWRRLGHPFWFFPPFRGIELQEIADEIEHFLGVEIDNVPSMKSNLLFQYKKPEYITMRTGAEWKHWNKPYFRYNIYQEQQELLMHIHNTMGTNVFVVYASPAIYDVNELVRVHRNRQLLECSNFKKASELNGHHRNTYIQSGTYSIACSEPKKIENFDLISELEKLSESIRKNDNENNRLFIKNFSRSATSILKEDKHFSEPFRMLNETILKYEKFELLYSFLSMMNFRQLTGIQWLIKI